MSITVEQPFKQGDLVSVGSNKKRGRVEAIGVKTTRIRMVTGELAVYANKVSGRAPGGIQGTNGNC